MDYNKIDNANDLLNQIIPEYEKKHYLSTFDKIEFKLYESLEKLLENIPIDYPKINTECTYYNYLLKYRNAYSNVFRRMERLEGKDIFGEHCPTNKKQSNAIVLFFNLKRDIKEIMMFLENEMLNEKINLLRFRGTQNTSQPIETPEIDFSGKDELKPKQKLIILNELGVIDFINDKLQDKGNATHLSEILNTILGVGQDTLRGYVNLLIRPDETQRNSPYNSEKVVSETMQILNKFKLKENGSR